METLKDKNVLIVAATGGIGSHAAKLLAGSGAKLFLTGRNADKLAAIAASCNVPVERTFALDISQPEAVNELKEKYFSQLPGIDILILPHLASRGPITKNDALNLLTVSYDETSLTGFLQLTLSPEPPF